MYWNRIEDFFNQNNNITHVIVTIDMTDIIDLAYSWQEIPSTKYPVIKSHHVKKEIDNWDKIKDSNFKGFRLLTFYLRNLLRSIKNKLIDGYDANKDTSLKSEIANFTYTDLSHHSILDKIKFERALNDIGTKNLCEISRKNNAKPILKAAHIEESLYIGDENL